MPGGVGQNSRGLAHEHPMTTRDPPTFHEQQEIMIIKTLFIVWVGNPGIASRRRNKTGTPWRCGCFAACIGPSLAGERRKHQKIVAVRAARNNIVGVGGPQQQRARAQGRCYRQIRT